MFTQAQIDVQNKQVFAELQRAIENALGLHNSEFLQLVKRFGLRVRDFERILHERVFEQLPGQATGKPCEELFSQLSLSDQGLIREFYLTRVEEVPGKLRAKYAKLYRYQ